MCDASTRPLSEEAKQRHNHPEECEEVSVHALRAEIPVQLHRPSWGRCVIQQIQTAADDQNEQAQPHDAGKSHEQDEDPLSHSCLASCRLSCFSSCYSSYL